MPRVEVVWEDSNHFARWLSAAEIQELLDDPEGGRCRSVGYLYAQDERHVVIVQSTSVNGSLDATLRIPAPCIVSMKRLGVEGDDAA